MACALGALVMLAICWMLGAAYWQVGLLAGLSIASIGAAFNCCRRHCRNSVTILFSVAALFFFAQCIDAWAFNFNMARPESSQWIVVLCAALLAYAMHSRVLFACAIASAYFAMGNDLHTLVLGTVHWLLSAWYSEWVLLSMCLLWLGLGRSRFQKVYIGSSVACLLCFGVALWSSASWWSPDLLDAVCLLGSLLLVIANRRRFQGARSVRKSRQVSLRTLRVTSAVVIIAMLATYAALYHDVSANRAGEPESLLQLTEREFTFGQSSALWKRKHLKLQWNVVSGGVEPSEPKESWRPRWQYPTWFTLQKLHTLGFTVDHPHSTAQSELAALPAPRTAFLVLELGGSAYREAVRMAQQDLDTAASEIAHTQAQQELHAVQHLDSQLYVIDAGRDAAQLRAQYPDRSQYMITRGLVAPGYHWDAERDQWIILGRVAGLTLPRVAVSNATYARIIAGLGDRQSTGWKPRYRIDIAHGQHFEPWAVQVHDAPANATNEK